MTTNGRYQLRCCGCDATYDDDGVRLACANGCTALLRSEYVQTAFAPDISEIGTFRYHEWLPVRKRLPHAGSVAVFRAHTWGRAFGLSDLWIAFSGLWPDRGASLASATFKELEAYAVLGRLPDDSGTTLVVASAGNTAAAFARVCSTYGRSCAIVVPSSARARLIFPEPLADCVSIVEVRGTYDDAIAFSRALAARDGFVLEGGVRNVARRDGMGTVMLAAVETMGGLPDAYVQAVGSGAGALAAHEAARRLVGDGRFGARVPRLMLAQNAPFTPMVESWAARSATLLPVDAESARERIAQIGAKVLSNQTPPYAVPGGVYEALVSSAGDMFSVTNAAAASSAALFRSLEGVDLEPAAAVALATLPQVATALGSRDQRVLLHLTGGGWETFCAPHARHAASPALVLHASEIADPRSVERAVAAVRGAVAFAALFDARAGGIAPTHAVVIAESLGGGSLETFERIGARVRYEPSLANDRRALLAAVRDAHALVVRNTVRVDRALLAQAPALRAIGRLGTGLDNIDVVAVRERGIAIVDAGDANANAVSEYVIGAMLETERRFGACDAAVRAGTWPRFTMPHGEIFGKTLGIVGLGRCGTRLAVVARALGMEVLGTRRTPGLPAALEGSGVERVEANDLFERSHFVVLLATPNATGEPLAGRASIARMRRDAVLINAGRGSLVDEAALLDALCAERLRGAVLDTRASEPPAPDDALAHHPLVLNSPHVGGLTMEAQLRVAAVVARGLEVALGLSPAHA
jgi:cysteate synthase